MREEQNTHIKFVRPNLHIIFYYFSIIWCHKAIMHKRGSYRGSNILSCKTTVVSENKGAKSERHDEGLRTSCIEGRFELSRMCAKCPTKLCH